MRRALFLLSALALLANLLGSSERPREHPARVGAVITPSPRKEPL